MKRRSFLVGSAALVGGGLAVGYVWSASTLKRNAAFKLPAAKDAHAFNAWLAVHADNTVTVAVPRQEMGQGINTMLAMFVAEELEMPMASMRVTEAPIAAVYGNVTMLMDGQAALPAPARAFMEKAFTLAGIQATGGSTSTRDGFMPMRTAAANAREILIAEAATRWNVAAESCIARDGHVVEKSGSRKLTFGTLADAAAKRPPPANITLKPPEAWRVLGTSPPRLDIPAKVDGSAQFGIDVQLPGMLYAAVKHIENVRGALHEVRWQNGAAPKSVITTAQGDDWFAVLSTNTWLAQKALNEVTLAGGGAGACTTSSDALATRYAALLDDTTGGRVYAENGNALKVIDTADVDVRYHVPFQAHATLEPMNCTVHLRDGKMDVWFGNQSPTLVRWVAAEASGIPSAQIIVHTPYLGGGFGRRIDVEVLRQAIACAKVAGGKPVKLTWSREEDTRHDAYRPAVSARMRAKFDAAGNLSAWQHHMAGMSVMFDVTRRVAKPVASDAMPDFTNCEGAAHLPYALPNFRVTHSQVDENVPLGFWRSVGNSYTAFFVESFVDELAISRQEDPYLFRLKLLKDSPRFARVLDAAASKAGWASQRAPGVGRGIAIAESFKSIVAMVVDVRIADGKTIIVDRVVAAVDCGRALHPANTKTQIEGGIAFALTAALKSQISLKDGVVQQRNFNDFQMLRGNEMPRVEVHIVDSGEPLGGIGEVGVPPLAPALGNAIFSATGKRLRALPFVMG